MKLHGSYEEARTPIGGDDNVRPGTCDLLNNDL